MGKMMISRWRMAVLLLLATAILWAQAAVSNKIPAFAEVRVGDVIIVDQVSRGCFHWYHHEFRFEFGEKTTVTIYQLEHVPVDKEPDVVNRHKIATLPLTHKDLAGLDKLVAFYRATREGGCTDVDEFKLSHLRGEKVLAKESFKDASCTLYRSGLLTFDKLVDRILD